MKSILKFEDVKPQMVLQSTDNRMFVVCDIIDFPYLIHSNSIVLKEIVPQGDYPVKVIDIDVFKKTLQEGKIYRFINPKAA